MKLFTSQIFECSLICNRTYFRYFLWLTYKLYLNPITTQDRICTRIRTRIRIRFSVSNSVKQVDALTKPTRKTFLTSLALQETLLCYKTHQDTSDLNDGNQSRYFTPFRLPGLYVWLGLRLCYKVNLQWHANFWDFALLIKLLMVCHILTFVTCGFVLITTFIFFPQNLYEDSNIIKYHFERLSLVFVNTQVTKKKLFNVKFVKLNESKLK